MSVLDAIGNTSMVELRRVVPPDCARIFVQLEWENPTGSMKDRMANAVIARAEADGRLKPATRSLKTRAAARARHSRSCAPSVVVRFRSVNTDVFRTD